MYPNLYYAFKDLFNIDWKPLRFINSFGFFVALSFILAAIVMAAELRRKGKEGLLHPTEINVVVGKPASITELSAQGMARLLDLINDLALVKQWEVEHV